MLKTYRVKYYKGNNKTGSRKVKARDEEEAKIKVGFMILGKYYGYVYSAEEVVENAKL